MAFTRLKTVVDLKYGAHSCLLGTAKLISQISKQSKVYDAAMCHPYNSNEWWYNSLFSCFY